VDVLANVVPFSVAMALSPIPAVVVILLLSGRVRPMARAVTFVLGWLVVQACIGVAALNFLGEDALEIGHSNPSTSASVVRLVLGLLLVVAAMLRVFRGSLMVENPEPPKLLNTVHSIGVARSFGLGFILEITNLKNLPIYLAAILAITRAGVGRVADAVMLTLVIAISMAPMLIPIGIHAARPAQSRSILDKGMYQLLRWNPLVIVAIMVIVGAYLILKGLTGLI